MVNKTILKGTPAKKCWHALRVVKIRKMQIRSNVPKVLSCREISQALTNIELIKTERVLNGGKMFGSRFPNSLMETIQNYIFGDIIIKHKTN